eukprot:GAFH01002367.1.p4 GENE.GAFH01002367.1~~GAFH01002367.1.p4  ORF type:complete len:86 (-),score=1.79 GAFH01002367.1:373-630(-)
MERSSEGHLVPQFAGGLREEPNQRVQRWREQVVGRVGVVTLLVKLHEGLFDQLGREGNWAQSRHVQGPIFVTLDEGAAARRVTVC